jgi:protein-tyrosine phosphatase
LSIFGNIFKSDKLKIPVDLGMIGTDMHSHLIPGIDDGSKSLEESVSLLKRMHELGYKKIITTPHIMSDYYKNNKDNISKGLQQLREELEKQQMQVQIEAAAEYMVDDGFLKKFRAGELLTFGNKHLLIELSWLQAPENLFQILFDLKLEGYNPIIAHPERYAYWHQNFEHYVSLKDREVFFQINLPSLSGFYSPHVRKICEELIDNNMVDFVGSDLHDQVYLNQLERSRYSKHLEKLINSGKLLNGTL